jgi:hypothetical protein
MKYKHYLRDTTSPRKLEKIMMFCLDYDITVLFFDAAIQCVLGTALSSQKNRSGSGGTLPSNIMNFKS